MTKSKVIIDTDPGIDDAMAILFACQHPQIDLVGLTSIFGNVKVETATRNALALSDLARHPVPVARGAAHPLGQPPREPATHVHGIEGFGHLPPIIPRHQADGRSAAAFICDMANAHPGELVLCPVGPLTNLALALDLDPGIAQKVRAVHVMGGSLRVGGNVSDYAEANIWQDPHAADQVFAAGWDVKLIGLDVTHSVTCQPEDFDKLAEAAPVLGGFLKDAAKFYFEFHEWNDGFYGAYMHDALAVISIIRPELFTFERHGVMVRLDGAAAGETFIVDDPARAQIQWASDVQVEAAKSLYFETLGASF